MESQIQKFKILDYYTFEICHLGSGIWHLES
jgi:hypothetical protein